MYLAAKNDITNIELNERYKCQMKRVRILVTKANIDCNLNELKMNKGNPK